MFCQCLSDVIPCITRAMMIHDDLSNICNIKFALGCRQGRPQSMVIFDPDLGGFAMAYPIGGWFGMENSIQKWMMNG